MRAALIFLCLTAGSPLIMANVPILLSYQGKVTDASGQPIGNSSPVNRTATFRLYVASSGGSPIYAEAQTVTISAGEFSVLLGNGTGVSGQPGPSAPATTPYKTLSDIVNDPNVNALYLGITVDDGNPSTVDAEISPRQQLVSGAYALRAKVAEGVKDRSVTTAMIADNAITTNQIAAASINSSKIANNAVSTAQIAGSAVDAARINQNSVGVWTPSGSNVWRNSNVGIFESNPGVPLTFSSALGPKISFYGNNGAGQYGLGVQGGRFQYYVNVASDAHTFGMGNSTSFTEWMRVVNGNFGVGTTNPTERLHIVGNALFTPSNWGQSGSNSLLYLGDGNNWLRSVFGGRAELFGINGIALLTGSGAPERIRIQGNGNVGIGTTNPTEKLTIESGNIEFLQGEPGGYGIGGTMAGNDRWKIFGYGSGNNGSLYIDTYDDGTEPIIFRQQNAERMRVTSEGDVKVNNLLRIGTDWRGSSGSTGVKDAQGSNVNLRPRLTIQDGDIQILSSDNKSQSSIRSNPRTFVIYQYNSNHASNAWRSYSWNGDDNWDLVSDIRFKENVEDAEPMLDRLLQVPFRRFDWKDQPDAPQKTFGVIAQEIIDLFPDIVDQHQDPWESEPHLTVGYSSFGKIAAKAVQELAARTDEDFVAMEEHFAAELASRDARIADLEARLQKLEAILLNNN